MDLHLEKDHGVRVKVGDREKNVDPDPEKMQEKIKKIYKKKTSGSSSGSGYTKSILNTENLPTIYEPITFGSVSSSSQREEGEAERKTGEEDKKEPITEGYENVQSTQETKVEFDVINLTKSLLPIAKIQEKIDEYFKELANVIGYNDIQNKSLPTNKTDNEHMIENSKWLQGLIFEFFLVFFSYIITYNIYYFVFIYNWKAETPHFDPNKGFMFGGVFKSFMDDWLMRDIRYPMLVMGYVYSWLIPGIFKLIGVKPYPKLCFLIILLHTMIINFTQGPNAAMSVESLLGGSPSILILVLNLVSCLGAFFDTSMSMENAIAWIRFYSLFLSSCVGNIVRILIAFFGVFVSQIMVYLFFLYTTSGLGLLWEAKLVNIGDKIKEINDHIGGKSGAEKNYCKEEGTDPIGIWEFINKQVEPHFSWIFVYLLMLYVIVKTIATFFVYNGESAKLFLCYFLIILGVTIWLIVTSVFGVGSGNEDPLTTIVVKGPSMFERAKQGVEGLSDYRKRTLTNLSNQGNNFLSKTVGQTARNARNYLSDNAFSRTVLGDDTFTPLDPQDKETLQKLTGQFNDMVTSIDSVKDNNSNGEETQTVQKNIEDILKKNDDLLKHIAKEPQIKTYIESKLAKGKPLQNILSSMIPYILSRAGANPKVSAMASPILSELLSTILGPEEKEEKKE